VLANWYEHDKLAFVGFASAAEALQNEPASLQDTLLYLENTARQMHRNTRLGVGLVLPRQWAQLELAAHTLQVVGHIHMDKRDIPTQ